VSHFPPGTSKWNKVEHQLFSFITMSWRGRPLRTFETVVNLISETTNRGGLVVRAGLDGRNFPGLLARPSPHGLVQTPLADVITSSRQLAIKWAERVLWARWHGMTTVTYSQRCNTKRVRAPRPPEDRDASS
jgi:hypothetical protein